jgi:hypothetical protein
MAYNLFDSDRNLPVSQSAVPVAEDAYLVNTTVFNRVFLLAVSPVGGWLQHTVQLQELASLSVAQPAWAAPMMAVGGVSAVALALAVLAMLVQKHFHQTLLKVRRGVGYGWVISG